MIHQKIWVWKYQKAHKALVFAVVTMKWMTALWWTLCSKVWSYSRSESLYVKHIFKRFIIFLSATKLSLWAAVLFQITDKYFTQPFHNRNVFFNNFKILEIGLKCRPWMIHELYLNIWKAAYTTCHTIQSNVFLFTVLIMGFDVTDQNNVKALKRNKV